jgi:hypothetical protein
LGAPHAFCGAKAQQILHPNFNYGNGVVTLQRKSRPMLIAARQAARSWAVDGPPSSPSTTASSTITNACNAVPLHGSNFAYTFTLTYFSSCTGAGTPAGTYGIATMTITTPAAPASLVNYLNSVTGLTLSASATLQEEFVCPAAGPVTTTVSNRTC